MGKDAGAAARQAGEVRRLIRVAAQASWPRGWDRGPLGPCCLETGELHEPKKKSGENRLRGDCKVWMKPSCATWNDNKRTKDQTIMKQSCNPLVKDFFHRSSQMYLLNRQIASAQHEDLGWKFKPNRYFSFSMHLRFLCLGSPWRSSTEATIGVDLACWDLNWMIIAEFQPGAKCECKIYL